MAVTTITITLKNGTTFNLNISEAESLFKDLEKLFGGKTFTLPNLNYPPGVRNIGNPPVWVGPAVAQNNVSSTTHFGELSGEAH